MYFKLVPKKIAVSLAVGTCALLAATAQADWGIKLNLPAGIKAPQIGEDPSQRRQRFETARKSIHKAMDLVPERYGEDPQAEKEKLDKAEAEFQTGKKALTPDLMAIGDEYKQEDQNLKNLEATLKEGRLMQACSAAKKVITDAHAIGKPAGDKPLKAFEETVNKLDAGTPTERKKNVTFWRDEATRLRKIDPEIKAPTGQAAAAPRTPSEKAKYEKAMKPVSDAANKIYREIEKVAKSGDEPITAGRLAELKEASDKVKAVDEKASHFYEHLLKTYAIENAWRGDEKATAAEIVKVIGGEVTTAGATEGKKLSVSFKAKKGSCYTAMMRFRVSSGQEKIEKLEMEGAGGDTPLQFYHVPTANLKWERIQGICATKDVTVNLTGELVFAGTRNAVRYAVISHTKDKFPLYLATYSSVWSGDSCDQEAWGNMWFDPVPGSVVYSGKEAFLMTSPDRAGQSWNSLANVTHKDSVRLQKKQLSQTPPKPVQFASQFGFGGCSRSNPKHPDSIKIVKCHEGIDKKYQKPWDAATLDKKTALTPGAYRAAELKLEKLKEQDANDRAKQCDPLEAAAAKKAEAMYNKIVDFYADHPYVSPIDRAGELFAQDEAWLGN